MSTKEKNERLRQNLELQDQGLKEGAEVTASRRRRQQLRGRSADEVKELRLASHTSAAVCADCFTSLAPTASVTMTRRFVEHISQRQNAIGMTIPKHDRHERVVICLSCWLIDLLTPRWGAIHGRRYENEQDEAGPRLFLDNRMRRLRCEACRRPMRFEIRYGHRLTLYERCCCEECFHTAFRRHDNARRRVVTEPRACVVCGTVFTPRKSNAVTCSGKCRVKKMRTERTRR